MPSFSTSCLYLSLACAGLLSAGCQTHQSTRTQDSQRTNHPAAQSVQLHRPQVPPDLPTDDPFVRASQNIQGKMNYDWQLIQQVVPAEKQTLLALPQLQGKWVIDGDKLIASQGDSNRTILLAPSGHDPIRIELEVTMQPAEEQRIGDITILLNTANDAKYWKAGYALTTGSYWNNCTTFYRHSKALANTQWSPLKPGVLHKVVLEFDHGQIRYWLDGNILLEAWDYQPLAMDPDAWIGLRTWNTRMTVHGARIYKGIKPTKKVVKQAQ